MSRDWIRTLSFISIIVIIAMLGALLLPDYQMAYAAEKNQNRKEELTERCKRIHYESRMAVEKLMKWVMRSVAFILFLIDIDNSLYWAMLLYGVLFVLSCIHLYRFGKSGEALLYFIVAFISLIVFLITSLGINRLLSPPVWIALICLLAFAATQIAFAVTSLEKGEEKMLSLSAHDIHRKKFKRSLIGFNIDEVNEFLDQIIRDYEELESESGEKIPRLSVHDIHRKKFKRSLFGFDIDEVNDFLDKVIIDYEKRSCANK